MPLADELRPKNFDEIVGQKHLVGAYAPFRRMIESGHLPSIVLHGPSGTGKTTIADIVARMTGKHFVRLNATVASLSDVHHALEESASLYGIGGMLLYIDEIQYFNKKQQQSLLEYVEDGRVTLICSTTENPYFAIYGALLSRSSTFEVKPVEPKEIEKPLSRALAYLNEKTGLEKTAEDGVFELVASRSGGDVRKALGCFENVYFASGEVLDVESAKTLTSGAGMRFDRDGNEHYDLLSGLQKSIRGSDENAALYYLAKLLHGGDLLSPCRRLLVIASEDIGLAYPMAAVIVKSCVDSALQLGLPEARIPLSQAVVLLATAPKSNSAYVAYDLAAGDVEKGYAMPYYLQSGNEDDYIYPHPYPNSYVKQQYLPDEIKDKKYYTFGNNKTEQAAKSYWDIVKNGKK
ncbi:MAG: replication-associated recombination protein A [Clostridia bacterium]|nr:replication-associated recombination protein A [Clostridia bacterium]